MTQPEPSPRPGRLESFGLNPWLQRFLTIIAGTVVAVIAWTIVERFLHILILLLASFVVAFLMGPLVDRLQKRGVPRVLAILILYVIILGGLTVGGVLLVGPLTAQVQGLLNTLPTLFNSQTGAQADIDRFFQQWGIPVSVASLSSQLASTVTGAGGSLLNGTLSVLTGVISFITDLLLVLAITFYLLLDGTNIHTWALRLLPAAGRERWFFVEATLDRVMGGYLRGQIVVAATVGIAAGLGSAVLGVHYPLVIGLLAFLFEFIPMIGPVLGMIPAVILALFQPQPLVWWVILYFIVLQQVESNVIVPRVSGQAVGLHPLAVLLALLAGVELAGLGGALLAVPLVGVLYVVFLALYSDATSQTQILTASSRPNAYATLRRALGRRGGRRVAVAVATPVAEPLSDSRLASIAQAQAALSAQFAAEEANAASAAPPAAPAAPPPAPDPPAA